MTPTNSEPHSLSAAEQRDRAFWTRAALLLLLVFLAYSSVFRAGYIWDDADYVTANPHLRSLGGLARIWSTPGATPQYYPLVFTVFWAEYHLWGLDPLGYHLVNIALHAANALLLWACGRRLGIPGAFWAACLFALHPVQVESVAWIAELKNLLSTCCYFLAFLCYCRHDELASGEPGSRGRPWASYLLALFWFILALFSKTVTGSLPAAILLVFWWQRGRFPARHALRLAPFFVLAIVFGRLTARLEVDHVLARGAEWDFSFVERLLIAGRAVWFYLAKLFWPHPLIFNYPRWRIDAGAWWQYLYPAGVVLLLLALWLGRKRLGRGPLAGVLFFLGTLFPALGFFNLYPMRYSFVADHFQYLACAGIFVLCGAVAERLLRDRGPAGQRTQAACCGVLLLLLALLTWNQGRTYRNALTLFDDVVAKNPSSWMGYNNRGAEQYGLRRYDQAMADFERSLELNPANADGLNNRGLVHLKRREFDRALADFDAAVALEPSRFDYYGNRSMVHWETGKYDRAVADCTTALTLDPYYLTGYLRRALAYGMLKEYGRAADDLTRVVQLDPYNAEAHANRGLVFYYQGRQELALADFDRALALNPGAAPAWYNRGLVNLALGRRDQARADLERARTLGHPVTDEELRRIFSVPER